MPKSRLRIAQIITGLGTGGAERLVLNLTRAIDPDEFDVRIISLSPDLDGVSIYGHDGLPVSVFNLRGPDRIAAFLDLRRYLGSFRPAVIHAHMFHALIASLAVKSLLPLRPSICFTSHLDPYPPVRAAATRALRPFRDVDVIFVEGQHPHMNSSNSVVIPNGVPFGPRPPRAPWRTGGPLRLLAVGRLAEQKNPIGMIDSLKAAGLSQATLEFVGDGPLLVEAQAHAAMLGLQSKVKFHGISPHVERFMLEADILVMHSRYEGMPMALLEAAALAMPVVSTPVGAAEAVLGSGRGFIADEASFPETLRSIAAAPNEAIARGRQLYDFARAHYSLDSVAARHQEVYRRAAGRNWQVSRRNVARG